MLTVEMLQQNTALTGLTEAQLNAIAEMSRNDENTVIGTRIAGIPEQIDDHKTGLLIPPSDPEALAKAMKEIMTDKDFYKFCAGNAKNKFEKNYTAQISVKNYMILYDSMLNGNSYGETNC